jgi:hypothetical protein
MMKTWWVAFLFACTSEPKPAPVAPSSPVTPTASASQPAQRVDHEPAEVDPAIADVLVGTDPPSGETSKRAGADLRQEIADVREGGKSVAGRASKASDDPRVGTGMGPSLHDPAKPMAVDPQKPGRISVLEKQAFDNTTLTAELVVAKMTSAYIMGNKRCYREYLKKDPSAKGELVLKLTVDDKGRATGATAKGVANDVGDCTTAQMASWRFPIPKDQTGEATIAAFQIKLGLVPE